MQMSLLCHCIYLPARQSVIEKSQYIYAHRSSAWFKVQPPTYLVEGLAGEQHSIEYKTAIDRHLDALNGNDRRTEAWWVATPTGGFIRDLTGSHSHLKSPGDPRLRCLARLPPVETYVTWRVKQDHTGRQQAGQESEQQKGPHC